MHSASNAFAQISFRELLVWLGVYLKGSEEEKLKHIFDAFDQDGNKVLDHSEITNVLMVRMAFPSPLER
jgi:Ca2+-binding EF-hand superfamily protein